MGFTVFGFWVYKPLSNMGCVRLKKVMAPLLIIREYLLFEGALVHILK